MRRSITSMLILQSAYLIMSNQCITTYIPFHIKINLPKSDRGIGYGYSEKKIKKLIDKFNAPV